MAAYEYELLKCEGCGKTLGYIYISTRTGFYALTGIRYWPVPHDRVSKIEKTAFCESCFQQRLNETSINKPEPEIEKTESAEPQPERKSRRLVR